jgi:hypothetical protein
MTEHIVTEADQFCYLCSEAVFDAIWLTSFESHYLDDSCMVRLVGVRDGFHASVTWSGEVGFRVKVTRPDSYYSESTANVHTAAEAFSLVSLLSCD